jgi:hypothetical protein
MAWAVMNASWSRWPRRTGKTPPWEKMKVRATLPPKSCDLPMNRTRRLRKTAEKKWSQFEKWLGARITGPDLGTCSVPIARARYSSRLGGVRTRRARS